MPVHTVKQGDCISSIANQWGHFWETLWNHKQNQELVEQRKNPNALLAGDKVFVPEIRTKEEQCSTTRQHVFQLKGVPVKLQLQLLDRDGNPRANLQYTLVIDGRKIAKKTAEDGRISEVIAPNAKKAKLTLKPEDSPVEEYELQLGFMNPVTHVTGIQARLKNLGFYPGEMTGSVDELTSEALSRFQAERGFPVTGELDDATRAALDGLHGG